MLKLKEKIGKLKFKTSEVRFLHSKNARRFEISRRGVVIASAVGVFVISFMVGFVALRQQKPSISSMAGIDPGAYQATIAVQTFDGNNVTNSGKVEFNVDTDLGATVLARKQTVNVKTNAITGYKLYLSSGEAHGNLVKPAGVPAGSSGGVISANSGSHSNPALLDTNAWGYAIPSNANKAVNVSNFSSSYDLTLINGDVTGSAAGTKWAPLMPNTSPTLIQQTNSANNISGESLDIYYALKVNMAIPTGVYTNKIIYTTVIEATNSPDNTGYDGEAAVTPNFVIGENGGNTIFVNTSLKTQSSDGASVMDGYIRNGDIDIKVGGKTCSSPNIQSRQPTLNVTCSLPPNPVGNREVVLSIAKLNKRYRAQIMYRQNPYVGGFQIKSVTPNEVEADKSHNITIATNLNQDPSVSIMPGNVSAKVGGSDCTRLNVTQYNPVKITCLAPAKAAGSYNVEVIIGDPVNNRAVASGAIVYKKKSKGIGNLNYMQDVTSQICEKSDIGEEALLTDRRDNKKYKVRKAADGNCWMAQSLALILKTSTTLSSTNTDINGSWRPENNTQMTGGVMWNTGNYEYNNARSYYTNNEEYGVLYNWYAATAGSTNASMTQGEAVGSICPKGWQLPRSDFENVDKTYSRFVALQTDFRMLPFKFTRSGYYNNGGHVLFESGGAYWMNKVGGAENAYLMTFGAWNVNPRAYTARSSGAAVRCVAR